MDLGWAGSGPFSIQSGGLPHLHLLVFLKTDHKFLTTANIDRFITAEIPTEEDAIGQDLRGIIQSTMVYSHCAGCNRDTLCMQGLNPLTAQICRKGYPCQFQQETVITDDGYPLYRRRDTGVSFPVEVRTTGGNIPLVINNQRVVPYSPYFPLRYKTHIDVEVCGSVKAVKCIHK